jgi:hypothetical protein
VKTQFTVLLFLACLNLSMGMIIALNVPGTEWVQATNPSNASDYEGHFNATEIAEGWGSTPFSGIPIVGDIFSGFSFLFRNIRYLIDGFPMLLTWISDSYIIDASAKTAFAIITNVLRAIYAILMSVFFIEYISGRYLTD